MTSAYEPKDVYTCDGVTFEFPITFPVDRDADVHAFLTNPDGTTQRLIPNQDYTISEATLVTRVDDYRDPIADGIVLTIMRQMLFLQPSGRMGMPARTFKARIDSLTRMFQQLREQADRTLHVGQSYPAYGVVSAVYPDEPNPPPVITSLDPTNVDEGSGEFTLTVNGTGFLATSTAQLDGEDRATVYVSDTELDVTILAADVVDAGSFDITVTSPPPGGGVSNAVTFLVNELPAWDPATHGANITLSGNDLIATRGGAAATFYSVRATVGKSSGKWYWECLINTTPTGNGIIIGIGLSTQNQTGYPGDASGGYGSQSRPASTALWYPGPTVSGLNYAAGDVIGFALDMTVPEISVYVNNTLSKLQGIGAGTWYPCVGLFNSGMQVTLQNTLTYAPPSGFSKLVV